MSKFKKVQGELFESNWRPGKVAIVKEDSTKVAVSAHRRGVVAIHGALRGDGNNLHAITHVPTGRRMCIVLKETDAFRIADYFIEQVEKAGRDLDTDDAEEVVNLIPGRLIQWLMRCTRNHGWVNPEQVQRR